MIAEEIKKYTKSHPYRLIWRFDFDESLLSVCNINGDKYDINNLTEEDMEQIQSEFSYLKNIKEFIRDRCLFTPMQQKMLKEKKDIRYIDYVNEGFPNEDEETYSFIQYWKLSDGKKVFDYSGKAPLSSSGLFTFDNCCMPCMTRAFVEDESECYDYRVDHLCKIDDK